MHFFLLFSHDGFLEMPLLGMGVIKLIHAYVSPCSYKVQITYCRHLWLFICQYNHLKIANLEVKTSVLYTVYIYRFLWLSMRLSIFVEFYFLFKNYLPILLAIIFLMIVVLWFLLYVRYFSCMFKMMCRLCYIFCSTFLYCFCVCEKSFSIWVC